MEFKYPDDLVHILKKRWLSYQNILSSPSRTDKGQKIISEFPDDEKLKNILDIIYHASFLTEESRRIAFRIGYMSPSKSEQKYAIINLYNDPIKLLNPIIFSVSELLKMSPSVDPNQSILLICEGSKIESQLNDSNLLIWGVLDLGSDWWEHISGLSSGAICPPNILTFSSTSPGSITATTTGQVLFRLSAGQILGTPLKDLSLGLIGEFLNNSAKKLYLDSIHKLKVKKYNKKEDSDQHPYHIYYGTLNNILNFAKDKSHGATFIVIPEEINYDDTRLTDRINLKYILNKEIIWDKLVEECEANHHYYRLLFDDKFKMITKKKDASTKNLKDLIKWNGIHNSLEKEILDFENFVAQLSCVDGAVVLTTKLRIIGYGGEITAQSSSLNYVKSANDPDAKSHSKVDINSFGTRHRSAFRICSSFENCVAFVISQDGGIKAIKRSGPDVILWNYVSLGTSSI